MQRTCEDIDGVSANRKSKENLVFYWYLYNKQNITKLIEDTFRIFSYCQLHLTHSTPSSKGRQSIGWILDYFFKGIRLYFAFTQSDRLEEAISDSYDFFKKTVRIENQVS